MSKTKKKSTRARTKPHAAAAPADADRRHCPPSIPWADHRRIMTDESRCELRRLVREFLEIFRPSAWFPTRDSVELMDGASADRNRMKMLTREMQAVVNYSGIDRSTKLTEAEYRSLGLPANELRYVCLAVSARIIEKQLLTRKSFAILKEQDPDRAADLVARAQSIEGRLREFAGPAEPAASPEITPRNWIGPRPRDVQNCCHVDERTWKRWRDAAGITPLSKRNPRLSYPQFRDLLKMLRESTLPAFPLHAKTLDSKYPYSAPD